MDSKEILAVHSMLHLIFHRNKNQHHRTTWWKWLSMLKRATADLARSLDADATSVESQKQHLAAHIIPRCYMAFSTVVADNQFSTLGIVLMAALARLSKVTGISREMKMQVAPGKTTKKASPVTMTEDLGERVCREDDALMTRPVHASRPVDKKSASKEKPEKDRSSSKSVKKTKKKKNAIDDLFSGLF
ncbi:uncharacterized protein N7529_000861 [Penicillium soppii]|uniref:uncharacterized protein n=1 Tax=Penicillium soppii TaxID=69789 RepID=UPI002549A5E0|nr:uncharacterized protein N7529_000861 [Penicillium soppii]KAJ5882189.1 hypothetical protein N7529_000861 [Penicillium soppii]